MSRRLQVYLQWGLVQSTVFKQTPFIRQSAKAHQHRVQLKRFDCDRLLLLLLLLLLALLLLLLLLLLLFKQSQHSSSKWQLPEIIFSLCKKWKLIHLFFLNFTE